MAALVCEDVAGEMAKCANSAFLAALTTYNNPVAEFRQQTFSWQMIAAWEILLKARIVQQNDGDLEKILLDPQTNRGKDTIGLREALAKTEDLTKNCRANIEGLLGVRNQASHFGVLNSELQNAIHRFATGSVQNFMKLSGKWFGLPSQNLVLMPIGTTGKVEVAWNQSTTKQRELFDLLAQISKSDDHLDKEFMVTAAISIEINRGISGGGNIGLTNDPSAPLTRISDDEAMKRYSSTYGDLIEGCKKRYVNFKQDAKFRRLHSDVKSDPHCAYERKLNPQKPSSSGQFFYNMEAVFLKLDEDYTQYGKK